MDGYHINNLYLQWNRFYNSDRTRSFLIIKGGVCWAETCSLFACTDKKETYAFPIISVGYGYNYKLNEVFFFRPSIDFGLQPNLVNIEFSFSF